jgi:hypothetical protein
MTTRREFIGSVLGTLVASGTAFRALAATPFEGYPDALTHIDRVLELMRASRNWQAASRILLRVADGTIIRGPAIGKIVQPETLNPLVFHGQDLRMEQSVVCTGFILINPRNQLVVEQRFQGGSQRFNGPAENLAAWRLHNPDKEPKPGSCDGDVLKSQITLHIGPG